MAKYPRAANRVKSVGLWLVKNIISVALRKYQAHNARPKKINSYAKSDHYNYGSCDHGATLICFSQFLAMKESFRATISLNYPCMVRGPRKSSNTRVQMNWNIEVTFFKRR